MTNKDKFKEVFGFEPDTETMIPVCPPRGVECPFMDDGIYSECHCELWWGRQYKAPDNRKCEACKHHVIMVEVGDGKPPRHTSGCELWECKFEPKEPILDKIRAEIETKYGQCDICEYFEDYDYEENDISEYRPIGNIADILQMIDKYKAESEKA